MPAPATALFAALLALLYFGLTARVIRERRGRRIDMGTGGNRLVERYIRAQANFVETVPFALVLLLLLELGDSPRWLIYSLGAALLAGRIFHAWSFSFEEPRLTSRTLGTTLSQAAIVLAAILLLAGLIWP